MYFFTFLLVGNLIIECTLLVKKKNNQWGFKVILLMDKKIY